tara:strand:+ start:367 stop:540 length:174 start_codon:yes stop_codon:yes gene_type:complete
MSSTRKNKTFGLEVSADINDALRAIKQMKKILYIIDKNLIRVRNLTFGKVSFYQKLT